ncbi:MAG TPA: hypothetical protein ENN74_01370, partial [Firmicutes bacterium]|nr:hypothetical protein [Bacillota bacterium]
MMQRGSLKRAVALVIFALLSSLAAAETVDRLPERESFHLFLLVGQSNMAGRGIVEEQDRAPHPRVLTLTKEGQWAVAVDPIHFDKPVAGVGLGRTFGLMLAEENPEVTIGLIPCAVGGSAIAAWRPGAKWEQTGAYPYDDALRRTRRALQDGVLKGILWHQGESDSKPERAEAYPCALEELIERFRTDLSAPEVPFLIGQLGQFPDKPWDEGTKAVDEAQRAIAGSAPNAAFVSSDGLTCNKDGVHFDAPSLREFGRRYAEAYRAMGAPSGERPVLSLWPDKILGETDGPEETELSSRGDNVRRITDIEKPDITLYRAQAAETPSPAVLVCPGGGYRILAIDKEGSEVAEWLNRFGVTAVVLKYRVPDNREGAFQDAQRAMRLIRSHAEAWNIDPHRVGVIGFSAGGHLSARLSTGYRVRAYEPVDEWDELGCRPDFTILVYPAYLAGEDYQLAEELAVTPETPPA